MFDKIFKRFASNTIIVVFVFFGVDIINAQVLEDETPIVFNQSETADPGEIIGLQGHAFGKSSQAMYQVVKGSEKTLTPIGLLKVVTCSDMNISAVIPGKDIIGQGDLIAVWVKTGDILSQPVFINRARIVTVEYEELMPGTIFRVFGRNLSFPGREPEVVLQEPTSGKTKPVELIRHEANILTLKAPGKMRTGTQYRIRVSNGAGGKWGEAFAEEMVTAKPSAPDPFNIGTPWSADFAFYKNIYNIKTDPRLKIKAKGDSLTNDRDAIQQAIDRAHADGGGVVYLPEGKYRLEIPSGSGLVMKSKVVLKGDGPTLTYIQYGYGTPPPYPDPIGKGGWPDETTEGVAILWPVGTQLTGLADLKIQNVNTSGLWRHSLKSMPPKEKKHGMAGNRYFAVNCHFELSAAWGLSWAFIDRMAIVGCRFDSQAKVTWPWMWHCDGVSNFVVRNNRVHYSAGRFGFNEGYNGIIENNHITRYGDLQTERGETGGFNVDYAKDMVIMNNRMDVVGKPIASRNQGETILSQGCNPFGQSLGEVSQATASTITDAGQKWPVLHTASADYKGGVNPLLPTSCNVVAIVSGRGCGQWRYIVKNDETTLHVDRQWDVVPEQGSRYVVIKWSAEDWLVKDNILDDNHQGIMLYCGGMDVLITGNRLTNSGGIYLRSDQRLASTRYNLTWDVAVTDNKVINTNGLRSAHVAMYHVKVTNDNAEIFGIGTLGVEIRRNLVQASIPNVNKAGGSSGLGAEGYFNCVICGKADKSPCDLTKIGIIGTIMEDNIAINTDNAYQLSAGAYNTIIVPGKMENVPRFIKDDSGAQISYIDSSSVQSNKSIPPKKDPDPFIPHLTGQAPEIVKELGEEVQDGVKVRKVVFFSREYENANRKDSALIFAAIVRPEKQGNYPGLLVLHGGGGNAEIDKAKKWAAQGYVVVVLDEPGVANPQKIPFSHGSWEKFAYGENRFVAKPDASYSNIFDAVLASVQGLYLLHAQPDVIRNKIGITGISWGGYLTTMVSGLANSMICASFSVYGCGFYDKGTTFIKNLDQMTPEDRTVWLKYLDAGRRTNNIKTPFFIAAATNDNWFYPPAVMETLHTAQGYTNHLFAANANHSAPLPGGTKDGDPQKPGWLKMEQDYFDYYLKGKGTPLPEITNINQQVITQKDTIMLKVRFKINTPATVTDAHVYYSTSEVDWPKRQWKEKQAQLKRRGWYEAMIPAFEGTDWLITISDARPVSVSSDIIRQ